MLLGVAVVVLPIYLIVKAVKNRGNKDKVVPIPDIAPNAPKPTIPPTNDLANTFLFLVSISFLLIKPAFTILSNDILKLPISDITVNTSSSTFNF